MSYKLLANILEDKIDKCVSKRQPVFREQSLRMTINSCYIVTKVALNHYSKHPC